MTTEDFLAKLAVVDEDDAIECVYDAFSSWRQADDPRSCADALDGMGPESLEASVVLSALTAALFFFGESCGPAYRRFWCRASATMRDRFGWEEWEAMSAGLKGDGMDSVLEVIKYARRYLWEKELEKERGDISQYELHGALQYRICDGTDRLLKAFGEVTRKDAALMVEAWVMAQGTLRPEKPLKRATWPAA